MITRSVTKPDLQTYLELSKDYSSTLTCPCEHVAIKYEKFIRMNPRYHQYCLSYFTEPRWINYLSNLDRERVKYTSSGYISITNIFTVLKDFCHLADQTVNDALRVFYASNLVSGYVIERNIFLSEGRSFIDLFGQTTTNAFNRSFNLLRNYFNGNQVMLGYGLNFYAYISGWQLTRDDPQLTNWF